MLHDTEGNRIEEGDLIEVSDPIPGFDDPLYTRGEYTIINNHPFLLPKDNPLSPRELMIYDYIRIIEPIRPRELYGHSK